jgi:fatty-acyl-CoA synthase
MMASPTVERPWIDGLTIPQVLSRTVERCSQRDALVFPRLNFRRIYADFARDVDEVARALMALGIRHGDHIGLWATNLPQWVVTQFAAATVGAVLVNVNPAYRAHELAYVLNQADITALLVTDRFKETDFLEMVAGVCSELSHSPPGQLRSAAFPRLRHVVSLKHEHGPGMWSWDAFRARAASVSDADLTCRQQAVTAADVVNIQYTSGTTGFPKGAMLTHRNLLMNAYHVGQRLAFAELDRLCLPVPFYHCFGCVMGTLMCAVHGAAIVIPAEAFDPLATLQAIQDERCTAVYGVPAMFIAELNHPRFAEFNLRSLRTGIMAGSPCPIEVMRSVVHDMGARDMTIAYGLTEASPVITQTHTTDTLDHRVATVGTVLPGLEVQLVAPGTGQPVAPAHPAELGEPGTPRELSELGELGELWVRGHGVMKGYYNKPADTADAITPDGWLRTGDLARRTPDGYYRITGRIKDMIIRGGENIYPREIEEFLHSHPAIADVQVVGLPDVRYGEEVCAWIRLKPGVVLTEKDVKQFCRGKIAYFKTPRYVVFVDEYPTTVTGKVQKFKLRDMGIAHFGLHQAATVETA